jgi:hypothetical protein
VFESLNHLSEDSEHFFECIEEAVEKATIAGDLLELSQVATADSNAKGTWVFAAPPAFVERANGTIFILGIAGDDPLPLPQSLASRLVHDRYYRMLRPESGEKLAQTLRDLGLLELSERSWLRMPRLEAAIELKNRVALELNALGPSGEVAALLILDGSRNPNYYKGRWATPKRESGMFIARRPQDYGAPLWGVALLSDGQLQKFLDFPRRRDRWRGSDLAWHLQMAFDSCDGNPQTYRLRPLGEETAIDFFSPLPLWAERQLAIVGRPVERDRCLFSYCFQNTELESEEKFLRTNLWLKPQAAGQEAN